MRRLFIWMFALAFLPYLLLSEPLPSLNSEQLKATVTNSTFFGHYSDSKNTFALYFAPSLKVYIQRGNSDEFVYFGRWDIQDGYLISPWPAYDLDPRTSHVPDFYNQKNFTVYKLQLRPLGNNQFQPHKPKNCSCESAPEQTFPTCKRANGKVYLKQWKASKTH